jgi:tRNA dimethylallyltransferase
LKKFQPLIAIVGPTGSGKSLLAIDLAKKFNGEIICADSRTIYQGMLVGTGSPIINLDFETKPSPWGKIYLIEKIRHYLLHFISPDQIYSVAEFQKSANQIIENIFKRNKVPFLVGGSGLYLRVVLEGYLLPPHSKIQSLIRQELSKLSDEKLISRLNKIDPASARKIDPRNRRRIIRALEVSLVAGRPFSSLQLKKKPSYHILILGLNPPRETLYRQIDERVDRMMSQGLIDEVRKLAKKYSRKAVGLVNAIGYQEIIGYLKKDYLLLEAIDLIKFHTHELARRQLTWFRPQKEIVWVGDQKEAEKKVEKFLKTKIDN